MPLFSGLSDVLNRQTGGVYTEREPLRFFKRPRLGGITAATATMPSMAATYAYSAWMQTGQPGGPTTFPGAVNVPTNLTAGAMKQANPTGGRKLYLQEFAVQAQYVSTMVTLYDRLLHNSGLSGRVITAQAVGGTLTRYTDGYGNRIFYEIYSALGGNASNITATYKNHAGVTKTSRSVAIGTSTNFQGVGRFQEIPLAVGDLGVQEVTSVTLSGDTATVGDFGIVIAHPIATLATYNACVMQVKDLLFGPPELPEIKNDACLALYYTTFTANIIELSGRLTFIEA